MKHKPQLLNRFKLLFSWVSLKACHYNTPNAHHFTFSFFRIRFFIFCMSTMIEVAFNYSKFRAWFSMSSFWTFNQEEEESKERLTELAKEKSQKTLREKRSFFVRMVSDPKIYNPKIVKARNPPQSKRVLLSSPKKGDATVATPATPL